MISINSYGIAVLLCVVSMVCWGSWQNTQKLAGKNWRFELYYWDFITGIVLVSLFAALTLGSLGSEGRTFTQDLAQSEIGGSIVSAMIGGALWNLGTLLLVAAIAIAGMSVAFPIGGGIGWILGIVVNYIIAGSQAKPVLLFTGCVVIVVAIILSMLSYKKLATETKKSTSKGIVLSFIAGLLIAVFYGFVVKSLDGEIVKGGTGNLTPFTAVFFFSVGAFISTFIYNPFFMSRPVEGDAVKVSDYIKGTSKQHLTGVLGGIIWGIGMVVSFMAVKAASPAISYALSNAAPVVAASWGIFVWKEFANAPKGTNVLLTGMFICYIIGLVLITWSNV